MWLPALRPLCRLCFGAPPGIESTTDAQGLPATGKLPWWHELTHHLGSIVRMLCELVGKVGRRRGGACGGGVGGVRWGLGCAHEGAAHMIQCCHVVARVDPITCRAADPCGFANALAMVSVAASNVGLCSAGILLAARWVKLGSKQDVHLLASIAVAYRGNPPSAPPPHKHTHKHTHS